jgi:hypothetical protein
MSGLSEDLVNAAGRKLPPRRARFSVWAAGGVSEKLTS